MTQGPSPRSTMRSEQRFSGVSSSIVRRRPVFDKEMFV
eukprot:CAMPEP_0178634106 /NCGR_PEP_ID=MMETSP0698-20121128/12444_1 /TAXON_ID=265572 /ORGANISM="Extubocellulus spinifer, Strain CCMP396" /LENGTH=37 /DNA_ID= /DNA_START= /DNA_END= /DNA_ORIENTATION=